MDTLELPGLYTYDEAKQIAALMKMRLPTADEVKIRRPKHSDMVPIGESAMKFIDGQTGEPIECVGSLILIYPQQKLIENQ